MRQSRSSVLELVSPRPRPYTELRMNSAGSRNPLHVFSAFFSFFLGRGAPPPSRRSQLRNSTAEYNFHRRTIDNPLPRNLLGKKVFNGSVNAYTHKDNQLQNRANLTMGARLVETAMTHHSDSRFHNCVRMSILGWGHENLFAVRVFPANPCSATKTQIRSVIRLGPRLMR